ncbi:hypothetical protein [Brucella intermedia]|uniref:hypothetical protein n=1 Tax=Brucella intermedia TaxID=94625 RepID=UPI00124C3214|nr:hypothetical protein [Brucella intermedia]KAB2723424.1 hypothetical protein F9L02_21955 [Brucella intermedia]
MAVMTAPSNSRQRQQQICLRHRYRRQASAGTADQIDAALSRDASAFRVMASMRTPRSDAAENGLSHATAGKNTSVRKGDPHITLHHPALAEPRKKGTAPASGSPICER